MSVSLIMADSVRVDSVVVSYRVGGAAAQARVQLGRITDRVREQFLGSIPAGAVTAAGLEYSVAVYKGGQAFGGSPALVRLRTEVASLAFANVLPGGTVFDDLHPTGACKAPIIGALADDLTGDPPTGWRMFRYAPDREAYVRSPTRPTSPSNMGRPIG